MAAHEETLRTRYEVVGAETVIDVNRRVWQSYKNLGEINEKLQKQMLERNRALLRARRAVMMMRTEIRVHYARVFELMRGLRTLGAIGRTVTSMWQAYNIAQIRITNAYISIQAAQAKVLTLQQRLNVLQRQGLTTSKEYYETQIQLSEAQAQLKQRTEEYRRAQMEAITGYVGMSLQAGTLIAQLWMLYYRYMVLTAMRAKEVAAIKAEAGAHGLVSIALAKRTIAEWAHTAALKAKAVAAAIAHALTSPWMIPVMLGVAAAAVAAIHALGRRERGGYIPVTGYYRLHAGEYVLPRRTVARQIVINIYEARRPRVTAELVIEKLRRRGVV